MDHQFSQLCHLSHRGSLWIISSSSSAIMYRCGSSFKPVQPVQPVQPIQPSQPLWIIVDCQFSQFSQFNQFSHLRHCGSFWIVSSAISVIMDCCGSSVQPVQPVQPSRPSWIIVDRKFSQFSHLSHHGSLWIVSSASSASSAISAIMDRCGSSVQPALSINP